ncbi:MAG TPA: hypothetical protein VK631_12365 [Solirubrobacteraceae bacterium]|nr:hypothetical protein [Solirubrobacteraceae bacterium]
MRAGFGAALVSLALFSSACGSSSDEVEPPAPIAAPPSAAAPSEPADPQPTKAAEDARPGPRLQARLDAGAVALVDLRGRIGIQPRALEFAKGGRMEDVEWSRWTDRGAEGTGRMVGLVCDPTCAQGTTIAVPATITLSQPLACPAGRFFDRGRIEVASDDPDAQSTSWLAAPC